MMLFLCTSLVLASPEGDSYLTKIDSANTVQSAHMQLVLDVRRPNGSSVQRTLEIWQSEGNSRLVRLTDPKRLSGVGLLVSGEDQLHMFLPQYPPARRVVGTSRSDAFMGTDFAIDDLARLSYADTYHAEIQQSDETGTTLSLTPIEKGGQAGVLQIDSQNRILRHTHLTEKGIIDREIKMDDYRQIDGVWLAHVIHVTDYKSKRQTFGTLKSVTVNQPIPAEKFTLQNLENP